MAEVNNKHKKKGRKNNRKRFLCFFGSCFGISSKVSADHGGRKLVKDSNEYNSLGEKAVPFMNDQSLTLSSEIESSNGEIIVIEEAHHQDDETIMLLDPPPTDHQVLINPKSKNLDESGDIEETTVEDNNIGEERGCKTTKLSHAVTLPLPRPKKEKPTTDDGVSKRKNGNELIMAAKFDCVFGALIIMVTLIVMLIWGKICATLCAAAWFYFFPRFRANINKSYLIKHKYDRDLVHFDSLGVQEKGGFTRII